VKLIFEVCRKKRLGSQSVMEDASGTNNKSHLCDFIQETGQEKRPARMVGLSSLDSARFGTDAECGNRGWKLRQRGER